MTSLSEKQSLSEQEARAKLRESFLKTVSLLNDQSCNIITYELSKLEATFSSWKPDGSEILVTDLETPANHKLPSARLRTPDILALNFNKSIELPY